MTKSPKVYYAINSNKTREVCREVAVRQKTEYAIISAFVKTALKAGHTLGVNDGEETVVKYSSSYKQIMAALMSTDEDYILVYPVGATEGNRIGWVWCIYGNGCDVISDYTTNLDADGLNLMAKAEEVSQRV